MKNFKTSVERTSYQSYPTIQEQEIKFVRLQFTDITAMLKNIAVSSKNMTASLKTVNPSTVHQSPVTTIEESIRTHSPTHLTRTVLSSSSVRSTTADDQTRSGSSIGL